MTVTFNNAYRLAMVLVTTVVLSACAAPQDGPMCPMKDGKGSCCKTMAKDAMKGGCDMPCCQGK